MSTGLDTSAHLAALEQRVTGLENGVKDIVSSIGDLAKKIDQRSQTPWPVIWSALGVSVSILVAIGGLAYWPVVARVAKIEESVVPRQEHLRNWQILDRDLARLEGRIDRLEHSAR